MAYVGRFAPSPSGSLHFGSLVAAVGSYLDAKSQQGKWLLRIEDIDPPREVHGAAKQIIAILEAFGFQWDDQVLYQSQRQDAYQETLQQLSDLGLIYPCSCSRKQIAEMGEAGLEGVVYPGTCRGEQLQQPDSCKTLRLMTHNQPILFKDQVCGPIEQRLNHDIGDFVIRRADQLIAYQLAVVVDDAYQNITHVVRGADLLTSTPRQIYLQSLLGIATPTYAHLPLVLNPQGQKLCKQHFAQPVDAKNPVKSLMAALKFLNQPLPDDGVGNRDDFWRYAIENWDIGKL